MTVKLTFASMALAMVLGLFVCLCRLYAPMPRASAGVGLRRVLPRHSAACCCCLCCTSAWRAYGVKLSAMYTAILGFGLNYAAYEAEIYRSSIQAVPIGQWEAGRALGMSKR